MEDKGNRSFHVGLSKDATRKLTRPSGPPRIGILRAAIGGRALSVVATFIRQATCQHKIMPLYFTKAQFDAWVSTLKRVKNPHDPERKNACYYVGYCYWYDDTTKVTGEHSPKRSHATEHVWGPLIDRVEREAQNENHHDQMGKHYFRMGFAYLSSENPRSPVLFSKAHPRLLVESEKEDYEAGSNYESTYLLARCYLDGYGVEVNADLAFRYFLKAAKNGHVDAQVGLSDFYKWGGLVRLHDAYEWISKAISNQEDHSSARTLRILKNKAKLILDVFSTNEKRIKFLSRIQRQRNLLLLQEKKLISREGECRGEISAIASAPTKNEKRIKFLSRTQRQLNLLLPQEKEPISREGECRGEISAVASARTKHYAATRGRPNIGEKIAFGKQRNRMATSSRGSGSPQQDSVGRMEYQLNLLPHIITRLVHNGFHCRSSIELRLLDSRLAEGCSSENSSFRRRSICSPLMRLLLEFVVPRLDLLTTNLINKASKRKAFGDSKQCICNAKALPLGARTVTGALPLLKRQKLETREEKLRILCNNGDGGTKAEVASILGTLQSELQIDELSVTDFWTKGGATLVVHLMESHITDRSIQYQGVALFLKAAATTLKRERQKALSFNERATSVIVVALQSMKHHFLAIRIQQCGWALLRIVLTRYYEHTNLRALCRKVAKFAAQCLLSMNQCPLITESIGAIMWHFCRDEFCRNWFVEVAGADDVLQKVKEADIAYEHKVALNLLFSRLTQNHSCNQHNLSRKFLTNDTPCPFQLK